MSYKTYMGTFIDENDHNLQRKFGYKYRALKGIYPDAYKLPETEVSKAIDVFYDGDANEDVTTMTDRVRNYTTAKEPEWKAKYFGEAPKPKPQESYSSVTIKSPSSFAQSGGNPNNDDNLIERFVEHARQPKIEGYVNYPYCDTKAKVTGGIGTLMPNANFMQKFTVTSQKAPVSSLNPAWSNEQINTLYNKMDKFCKSYKIGVDKDGNDIYDVAYYDQQRNDYRDKYQEELPYFQDAELEAESKKYVRQSVLPVLRRNLSKIGLNFDTDFNDDGKMALMDMQYNLGENKFKFIRLYDRDDILNSNLSDATKVRLITNPNAYYSDKDIMAEVLDKGYWPGFTKALINKDAVELAKQSHRKGIHDERNDWTYNTMLNAFNK
ncbi:MAG: hypothetical protein E7016_04085 [Alphaproteobacteria bacterium]|nr:hypothetical protein [Alphaproteobacteria bacterium]